LFDSVNIRHPPQRKKDFPEFLGKNNREVSEGKGQPCTAGAPQESGYKPMPSFVILGHLIKEEEEEEDLLSRGFPIRSNVNGAVRRGSETSAHKKKSRSSFSGCGWSIVFPP